MLIAMPTSTCQWPMQLSMYSALSPLAGMTLLRIGAAAPLASAEAAYVSWPALTYQRFDLGSLPEPLTLTSGLGLLIPAVWRPVS